MNLFIKINKKFQRVFIFRRKFAVSCAFRKILSLCLMYNKPSSFSLLHVQVHVCVCSHLNTITQPLSFSLSLSHTHTHYCQSKLACFPTNFFSYSFMILQLSVCLLTYLPSAKSCLPTLVKHFKSTKCNEELVADVCTTLYR